MQLDSMVLQLDGMPSTNMAVDSFVAVLRSVQRGCFAAIRRFCPTALQGFTRETYLFGPFSGAFFLVWRRRVGKKAERSKESKKERTP